jgi:hypothetical protein
MTSKYLHFQARSLGYYKNPSVPIDNRIVLKKVWPKFKEMTRQERTSNDPQIPQGWWSYNSSWSAYNRYMTAIIVWSNQKGWTTTQFENAMFHEYN